MADTSELTAPLVHGRLREAADASAFWGVREELHRRGVGDDAMVALVTAVNERPESQARLLDLRMQILGAGADAHPYLLERYALLRAAQASVGRLAALPLPAEGARMVLEELARLCAPDERALGWFEAGRYTFSAICKLVTLRRFPAGQFHWEISGLPLSVFRRVQGLDRVRLAAAVLRMGGRRPVIVPHMPWRRQPVLLEHQQHLAYARMAEAMARRPDIRGLMAEAWFHAPDTGKASPHLAWVNRVFHERGGVVVSSGPAGEASGVFELGGTRRRLAEEGRFTPTLGVVVWPRRAMLTWAADYARGCQRAAG